MHPRCGNHGTFDPDSPCRPNLIARPRSTLLHIRLLPAFPRTIIWILRAPLEHRGFPLMIKRLCVTTAPAWAIGSTRENCVHSMETDFALYSADTFDELSTIRSIRRVRSFRNPRLNDGHEVSMVSKVSRARRIPGAETRNRQRELSPHGLRTETMRDNDSK